MIGMDPAEAVGRDQLSVEKCVGDYHITTDHFGCRFPKGIEEIVAGLGGGTPLYPIPATIVGIRRRRAKIYGLEPVLGVILVAMTSVVRQISCRIVHIARRRNPICGRIERK